MIGEKSAPQPTAGGILGHYRIIEKIGAGGMGVVYKGRDTHLDRFVALKVLPPGTVADPESRRRFAQEAKAASALNHPNIITVYDISNTDGVDFIAMEYVEGRTLEQLIGHRHMPLKQVLAYAIQIADALGKAHAAGIIHRDLKPSNIMVTSEDNVKILDFGLAKLGATSGPVDGEGTASTLETLTKEGRLLGTAAYMAPEQAEGKPVDARCDIFSFGLILYEMLTGRRPFGGDTNLAMISAMLHDEPKPLSQVAENMPHEMERLVKRCLRKDAVHRFQHMDDLKVALEELKEESDSGELAKGRVGAGLVPAPIGRQRGAPLRRPWVAALAATVVIAGVLTGVVLMKYPERASQAASVKAVIKVEGGHWLDGGRVLPPWGFDQPTQTAMAISSDGRFIVYSAIRENPEPQDRPQLYLRRTDRLEATPVAGTEGGTGPFLSPDDRWVGFWADGKLKKVPIDGGVPVELCDAELPLGASWGPDNTIVFSDSPYSGLSTVPANGGRREILTTPNKTKDEFSHRAPHWLPDGRGVVFTIMREPFDLEPRVALLDLKTRKWSVLLEDAADARYVPSGHLVFLRQGTLMAVPFDLGKREVVGQPIPAIAGVVQTLNRLNPVEDTAAGQYSVSDSGCLVYVPGGILPDIDSTFVWVDQKGNMQPAASIKGFFFSPRLSPDGQRIAYTSVGKRFRAWVYDLNRATATPLTEEGKVWEINWTPDGKRVVFNWGRLDTDMPLYWQPADGSSPMERLTTSQDSETVGSFSPDGATLAFVKDRPETGADILLLDLRSRRVTPFLNSKADEWDPVFSPDGRWLAYESDESGRLEIYVRPFPGPGGKWQISSEGGAEPLWARNGKHLFYRSDVGKGAAEVSQVWAVDVRTDGSFTASKPRLLFATPAFFQSGIPHCWDISLDDQRFLMVKLEDRKAQPVTEMILVTNWFEELKRLAPTAR